MVCRTGLRSSSTGFSGFGGSVGRSIAKLLASSLTAKLTPRGVFVSPSVAATIFLHEGRGMDTPEIGSIGSPPTSRTQSLAEISNCWPWTSTTPPKLSMESFASPLVLNSFHSPGGGTAFQ